MLTIQRMFDHMNWANKRILQTIENVAMGHDIYKIIHLFAHILHAEQIWLTRLEQKDSTHMQVWPEADITSCSELASENDTNYRAFLTSLTNRDLDSLFSYTNQSGKSYQTSIRDILTHVALHGQYHRGQINAMLRLEGSEPVNVDFITFVR